MRVVVAIDSFKGSITAASAALALRDGILEARPDADVVLRPMADGGEGTLDAFRAATPAARRFPVSVTGPEGSPTNAEWLLLPDGTAVVELAGTSGIELLGGALRGMDAGTRGFGEAIAHALDHGARRLVLGIGSSASTDGGAGMLAALGARVVGGDGAAIARGARGLAGAIEADLAGMRALPPGGVLVLTDVRSPLLGAAGAAAVYGPQKGLREDDVVQADAALARWADLLRDRADPRAPGAGAAGGTGFALLAWGARLVPGAPEVAQILGLSDAIAGADLVVTGRGSFDRQSAVGKVPSFVAGLAREAGAPVAVVAGRIAPDADTAAFGTAVSLTDLAGSSGASIADPARWLRAAGAHLAAHHPQDR